jgi:hypothetical protein
MSASELHTIAIANLRKRAEAGERLNEFEWSLITTATQAERPNPIAELAKSLQAQLEETKAQGKKPSQTLLKAAQEALKSAQGDTIWPDAASCAQELGVSVQTARNWLGELGIQSARTSISKIEVYRGLWIRERDSVGKTTSTNSEADDREQELRIAERQARVDERTQRLVAEANDAAKAGLITAVRNVRNVILGIIPSILADALSEGQDRLQFEGKARKIIADQLELTCTALQKGAPNGQEETKPQGKAKPNPKA